jgi:hypothetical protein
VGWRGAREGVIGERVASLEMTRQEYVERADSPRGLHRVRQGDLRARDRDLRKPRYASGASSESRKSPRGVPKRLARPGAVCQRFVVPEVVGCDRGR